MAQRPTIKHVSTKVDCLDNDLAEVAENVSFIESYMYRIESNTKENTVAIKAVMQRLDNAIKKLEHRVKKLESRQRQ